MVKTTKEIEGVAMHESSKLGKKSFFQKISFSWVGKKCLLRPQSQKKTKYCWAYASIGSMSAAVSIKIKKVVVPLSKQYLTDCLLEYYPDPKKEAKLKEDWDLLRGLPELTDVVEVAILLVFDTFFLLLGDRPADQKLADLLLCPWLVNSWFEYFKKVKIAGYQCINIGRLSKGQIEEHIKRQSIICSIRSYKSLKDHVGQSVYMGPTVKEIEDRQASLARGEKDSMHSMLIVGFGTDEDGQDYYLVQNSWGKDGGTMAMVK
ncbi:hypothetical protein BC332_34266 [Capsicum chinense]|nr:hypothetical protein BC332_34266 [Capsicum chinense]